MHFIKLSLKVCKNSPNLFALFHEFNFKQPITYEKVVNSKSTLIIIAYTYFKKSTDKSFAFIKS